MREVKAPKGYPKIPAAEGSPASSSFLEDESRSCLNLRCADTRDSRSCTSLFSCSGGRPLVPLYRSHPPSVFSTDFYGACNRMNPFSSCLHLTCRTLSSLRLTAWRGGGFSTLATQTRPRAQARYASGCPTTPQLAHGDVRSLYREVDPSKNP